MHDLESLLQQAWHAEVAAAPSLDATSCPPLTRVRAALLDPSRWTDEDRVHVPACARCEKTVAAMRREIWHPDLADLVRHAFGLASAHARHVEMHLERDHCRRCLSLSAAVDKVASLRGAADRLRAGAADALDRLQSALFLPGAPVLLPATAAVQGWDTATHEPFYVDLPLDDVNLQASLREERDGSSWRLHLVLETHDPSLAGRRVRFALVSDDVETWRTGAVDMSESGHEGWITGSADVGTLQELREQVGDAPYPFLYLDD